MTRNAIDASVALAWLLSEPRPEWVDQAMVEARGDRLALIAPALFWLEVGNRLIRTPGAPVGFALEAMLRAEALGIETVELERPVRLRALQLAQDHSLTMYDAAYLAVAEIADVPLLTLDRELDRAATAMGLGRSGPHRASETAAVYDDDRPVDRTSIAAIGAALAEMRKEYAL